MGFADLVGSTEVLRALSVKEMAEMVRRFEEQVWDLVSRAGGRVVKLIGDEAMFVVDDPGRACEVGLGLVEASPHPVRVGLAHGPVVQLYGDYYGETVNLAARLVRSATPSTLLVSQTVRDFVREAFTFQSFDPLVLKGFAEPVPVYGVQRAGYGTVSATTDRSPAVTARTWRRRWPGGRRGLPGGWTRRRRCRPPPPPWRCHRPARAR